MVPLFEPEPEFSRLVPIENLGEREIIEKIAANPEERAALARRFGLVAIEHLSASLRLGRREGPALIPVAGRFTAEGTQACVVTLEPIKMRLEETFTLLFSLAPTSAAKDEIVIDPNTEDPPEPVGPRGIDIGETVAQQLALALDPYPRVPGAELGDIPAGGTEAERASEGPFSALKALKHRP